MSAVLEPRAVGRATASRAVEFLVVGGATPLLLALSLFLRESLGLSLAEYWTGFTFFYAAHVLNDPHFAVTYLLFYRGAKDRALSPSRPRAQRVRYLLAGVVAPLALAGYACAALARGSAEGIGLMFQLMLLLVGWHYVKQGFGVATVLSARRGVRFTAWERRALLAHCYCGWAYAWASPADPGTAAAGKGVYYTSLAHPPGLETLTLVLFALSGLALVFAVARKLRREGPLPILTPMMGLLAAVWAWSVFSQADPLVRYAVPALHSLQYLYFVFLLRRNEAREREGEPYFEPAVRTRLAVLALSALALGLVLFDLLPMGLDSYFEPPGGRAADDALGPTPYFAALYAFVNLHHYCMDAVIWRRDNPETRYLLA